MEFEEASEEIVKDALKFVHAHTLAVVSTVSAEGVPESATVLYHMDGDFNLFFITRNDSRKVKNLMINKNIAVVIGTELGPSTMQMSGTAEALSSEEQKKFIAELEKTSTLDALYYGPFLNIIGINFTLYKVDVKWARWLTLDLSQLKEVYYQILPNTPH